jgi:uncharacterized protein (TIGR02246 family)
MRILISLLFVAPLVAMTASTLDPALPDDLRGSKVPKTTEVPKTEVTEQTTEEDVTPTKTALKDEIAGLFDVWNKALQTQEPKEVSALYAPNAILLPTLSNTVRHTTEEREDYFEHFLAKGPSGVIDQSNIRTFGDLAIHSGIYTFTFSTTGASVRARFTFVYAWNGTKWQIMEHHSSLMPEAMGALQMYENIFF